MSFPSTLAEECVDFDASCCANGTIARRAPSEAFMTTQRPSEQVLVTGASGFIGSHLAAQLAQRGDRVRCLVRCSSPLRYLRELEVEFAHGDLTGKDDLTHALAG